MTSTLVPRASVTVVGRHAGPVVPADDLTAELFRRYHLHMQRRNLRPRSIEKVGQQLTTFARWMAPTFVLNADRRDVEAFLDARDIGPRTRYTWIAVLHTFYKWAVSEELIDRDPTYSVVRPRLTRPLPRPIGGDDLARAIAEATPKHRAMLALAAYEGLRCQEIAALDRRAVLDGQSPPLLLVEEGKGGRERVLPLHDEALAALRAMPMPTSGRVFRRARGGGYSANHLSVELNAYLRGAGIPATVHQCRHWFGTAVYRNTRDLRLTQELLGHSDPSTTAGYVAWSPGEAVAAVASLRF